MKDLNKRTLESAASEAKENKEEKVEYLQNSQTRNRTISTSNTLFNKSLHSRNQNNSNQFNPIKDLQNNKTLFTSGNYNDTDLSVRKISGFNFYRQSNQKLNLRTDLQKKIIPKAIIEEESIHEKLNTMHKKSSSQNYCIKENILLKRTLDKWTKNSSKCYDSGGFNIPLFVIKNRKEKL